MNVEKDPSKGPRVNGKDWKPTKDAFRVRSIGVTKLNSFQKRTAKKLQEDQYKARLQELKEEKESAKAARLNESKRRKEIKAEKERFEMMTAKLNRKKAERLKRKEKRNKLLKER